MKSTLRQCAAALVLASLPVTAVAAVVATYPMTAVKYSEKADDRSSAISEAKDKAREWLDRQCELRADTSRGQSGTISGVSIVDTSATGDDKSGWIGFASLSGTCKVYE